MKGLGETLVGAYPGRALSFICKKNDLDTPKVNFVILSLKFMLQNVFGRHCISNHNFSTIHK